MYKNLHLGTYTVNCSVLQGQWSVTRLLKITDIRRILHFPPRKAFWDNRHKTTNIKNGYYGGIIYSRMKHALTSFQITTPDKIRVGRVPGRPNRLRYLSMLETMVTPIANNYWHNFILVDDNAIPQRARIPSWGRYRQNGVDTVPSQDEPRWACLGYASQGYPTLAKCSYHNSGS